MKVKWGNCLSRPSSVSNGVRQGGVLSPYLFALYIDDLSVKLNCVKAGCFLGNSRLNRIIYADDLCCFSPSLDCLKIYLMCVVTTPLNMILHLIVVNQLVHYFCLNIFRTISNVPKVFLCNNVVKFKNNVKYLGVFLKNILKDDDDLSASSLFLWKIISTVTVNGAEVAD